MKGFFKVRNPQKYKGNPREIIYRSSWELKYMMELDSDNKVVEWSSEEIIVPYLSPIDKKWHRYFVDFKVVRLNKYGEKIVELVEIKPHKQTNPPVKRNQKKKALKILL